MVEIYDFAKVPYSSKHGKYGGAAGDKDGVLIDNEFCAHGFPSDKTMTEFIQVIVDLKSKIDEKASKSIFDK